MPVSITPNSVVSTSSSTGGLTPYISTLNSSTTNLDSGNSYTFTGTAELHYSESVMVNLYADQVCSVSMQFSQDGTNWDSSISKTSAVGINEFTTAVKGARYFRIVVTTDSLTTTVFRLQTQFGTFRQGNAPNNLPVANDADAQLTRPDDFKYEVAMGRRTGNITWNKWGYNSDVDSAATETIWSVGGLFQRMTTADTLNISSTSTNDTSGGTGVRSIVVYGIDENREYQTEVVTLNGTSAVTTVNQWFGVNRVALYSAGSSSVNAGDINLVTTTGSNPQAQIPAGEGSTQQAIFHSQADHTLLMDWLWINVNKLTGGATPRVTIKCWVTSAVSGAKYEVFRYVIDSDVENTVQVKPSQPFVVGEKSIVEFQASTNTDNTVVNCRFSFIEREN